MKTQGHNSECIGLIAPRRPEGLCKASKIKPILSEGKQDLLNPLVGREGVGSRAKEGRKIALLGVTRNTDNYGVHVLLSSAVEVLSTLYRDAEIIVLDYGLKPEFWKERIGGEEKEIRLVNLRFSWRLNLRNNVLRLVALALIYRAIPAKGLRTLLLYRNQWLREISSTAIHCAISGGDSFSDIYGLRRFLYIALPQILVLLMNRPLLLMPQTYGPFRGKFGIMIARWIWRRAQAVFSRDKNGESLVESLKNGIEAKVEFVPDLGFCMAPEPLGLNILKEIENYRRQGSIVGLNPSGLLYMGGYTRNNEFQLRESFSTLLEALIDQIVQELDAQVLLVPHVCGGPFSQEDETKLCKRLQEESASRHRRRVHYLDYHLNHRQMKSLISHCDLFIGARMHACISAVSQGVPTVCLAYSPKFQGVMKPFTSGVKIADLRLLTIPEVLAIVEGAFRAREQMRKQLLVKISGIQDMVYSILKKRMTEIFADKNEL